MISLAVTNFNRSDSVIEAFRQVINNDAIDEIVIVDDFSDHDAYIKLWNLVNSLENDKIKLFRNDANMGPFRNKYTAVKKCINDWVILLDSDNIIDNNYIEIVSKLDKEEDVLYVSETLYREGKKGVGRCYKDFNKLTIDKQNVNEYIDMDYFEAFLNTGNHFFNKESYIQVVKGNKRDIRLSINDAIYFSYLWLLSGNKMKVVPDLYYIHQATKDSWWVTNSERCIQAAAEITRKIRKWQ